jgi:hypothetical protein
MGARQIFHSQETIEQGRAGAAGQLLVGGETRQIFEAGGDLGHQRLG